MKELVNEAITYLSDASNPLRLWEFIVTYVIPILGSLILVATALAGIIKYFMDKKRIYAERMLTAVYAPLFMYIVRQEYIRQKDFPDMKAEDVPLFSAETMKRTISNLNKGGKKIEQKVSYKREPIISLEDFYQVQKTIDFGMVPHNLLVLLSVCQLKENTEDNLSDEQKMMERALKKEIINGYLKYKKILGERKGKMKYIAFESDNITVKMK